MGYAPGRSTAERLLGRDDELAVVQDAVARCVAGSGGLLLVGGDAGAGKTTLVEAALAAIDVRVLRGRAHATGAVPLGPLRAALDGHVSPPGDVGDATTQTWASIQRSFEQLADQRPTVVFLDDLQWADAATCGVLTAWCDPPTGLRLLVIGAYRREELGLGHPVRTLRADLRRGVGGRERHVSLGPLDAAASASLVERVLGGEPDPDLVARLLRRGHGLPFYLEELAAAVVTAVAAQDDGAPTTPSAAVVPESVRDAVAQRLSGLSAFARLLAEMVAAAGSPLPLEVVSGLIVEPATIDELIGSGLLVELPPRPDGTSEAAFRHDLVAESVYAATPWARRRRHHAMLAQALEERGEQPAILAAHWFAASEPLRARPLLLAAAEAACRLHAYRDARDAIDRALATWPVGEGDADERIASVERLGECAERCGETAEAARALEQVAAYHRSVGSHVGVARVQRRLAGVYELTGDWTRALAARATAATAFAGCGQVADAASERLLAAAHLQSAGDLAGALELVLQARTEIEAAAGEAASSTVTSAPTPAAEVHVRALGLEGLVRAKLGEGATGIAMTRRAMDLALGSGPDGLIAEVYYFHADALEHATDYPAAIDAWSDASTFCRHRDLAADAHVCLACLVPALRHTGQWDRALEVGRELLGRRDVPEVARMVASGEVGLVLANRGTTVTARRHLARAAAFARSYELFALEIDTGWGLARVDVLDGDLESAAARLRDLSARCLERDERHYSVAALRWAASFFGRHGMRGDLGSCTDALARTAGATGTPEATGALAHALGESALSEGDARRAADQFGRALELLRSVSLPPETAETQLRAGVASAAAGDRGRSVELLVAAHSTARTLGARPLAAMAIDELTGTGEDVFRLLGRRAARQAGAGHLTPREHQVLRHVAAGLTNRQIAGELFLSPRTVDMHVRNLLAKLSCRTRTEAARRATELGLLELAVF